MNKWQLYDLLKCETVNDIGEVEGSIKKMDRQDLEEGVLEFLLAKLKRG